MLNLWPKQKQAETQNLKAKHELLPPSLGMVAVSVTALTTALKKTIDRLFCMLVYSRETKAQRGIKAHSKLPS